MVLIYGVSYSYNGARRTCWDTCLEYVWQTFAYKVNHGMRPVIHLPMVDMEWPAWDFCPDCGDFIPADINGLCACDK